MGRYGLQSNSGLAIRVHAFKGTMLLLKVTELLLWMQAVCQLFTIFHLPSASELPSIRNESWPAGLVMAVTDF